MFQRRETVFPSLRHRSEVKAQINSTMDITPRTSVKEINARIFQKIRHWLMNMPNIMERV
jgi:hypothetical protein